MPAVNPNNPATLPPIESFRDDNEVNDADLARALAAEEAGGPPDEGDDSEGGTLDTRADAEGDDGQDEGDDGQDDEGSDEGDEGDEGAEDTSGDAAPIKFKNEAGEEVETTLGDLKAKYQEFGKLQEFAQKTHDELQQVGMKAHQVIEGHRQNYTQALGKFNDWIMAVVAPEFRDLNLDELAVKDPSKYVAVKARIESVDRVLQGINQEREQQARQAQEEGQKARASAVQQAKAVLQKAIPGWNDQLYGNILSTAVQAYGFKPDEIGNVIDPRLVKMAHDAAQWQKLQSGKGTAEKKVNAAPKRVVKPGQGNVGTQKGGKTFAAAKQLRRTGSDADAVKLLLSKGIR